MDKLIKKNEHESGRYKTRSVGTTPAWLLKSFWRQEEVISGWWDIIMNSLKISIFFKPDELLLPEK